MAHVEFMARVCGKKDPERSRLCLVTNELFSHRCTCSLSKEPLLTLVLMLLWKLIYQNNDCQTFSLAEPHYHTHMLKLGIVLLKCIWGGRVSPAPSWPKHLKRLNIICDV